ncbi:CPBP family intramembrane glutamic endopeptidase [Terriglobus saanensis]|uniref:Abortive infection protein n=1 Tax=Terriglobus saanensis (strain ATCC BAA-1853 / DSM 23119 / SP1PR4) TaxID=401053 RepID=E8V6K5_TERSS|nr:CPBP family intramembrane glutamic endopeptidase [Terriglobus saanensis]ADV82744.1 Abortive infection protein [Terriglobus saanensis SP1PR4]
MTDSASRTGKPDTRFSSALQFVLGAAWMLVAFNVAPGVAQRFPVSYAPLVQEAVVLLLLLVGFGMLASRFRGGTPASQTMGLVRRKTAKQEWALGLALGWGMVAMLVLPMMLADRLHPVFDWSPAAWNSLVMSVLVLAVAALAEEIGFRGYPFQRLIEAIGEAWATVAMALIFGLVHLQNPHATLASTLGTVLAGILFAVAYLRTRALWLSWGLHLGWNASMAVLFGLPVSGVTEFSSVVQTGPDLPIWLTGGIYGPEGSLLASVVILIGMAVLVRTTRDYAWEYNYQPIVGAGYAMDVAPPAEHSKMEAAAAARPAPLVQILSSTPQGFTKTDDIPK